MKERVEDICVCANEGLELEICRQSMCLTAITTNERRRVYENELSEDATNEWR
jgi:hypothetical protein